MNKIYFLLKICKNCICFFSMTVTLEGVHGDAVGSGAMLQAVRSRVRFPMQSLGLFVDLIFLAALWPWSRLSV